jgi:hypothetical protein
MRMSTKILHCLLFAATAAAGSCVKALHARHTHTLGVYSCHRLFFMWLHAVSMPPRCRTCWWCWGCSVRREVPCGTPAVLFAATAAAVFCVRRAACTTHTCTHWGYSVRRFVVWASMHSLCDTPHLVGPACIPYVTPLTWWGCDREGTYGCSAFAVLCAAIAAAAAVPQLHAFAHTLCHT